MRARGPWTVADSQIDARAVGRNLPTAIASQNSSGRLVSVRWLGIIGLTALLAMVTGTPVLAASGASARIQPVVLCDHQSLTKPSVLREFGCGMGNVWAENLRWSKWIPGDAVATGEIYVLVCKPYCARGYTAYSYGSVHLFGQSRVGKLSYYVYGTFKFNNSVLASYDLTTPMLDLCFSSGERTKPPCDPHWPPKSQ